MSQESALLALIADLYAQVAALQTQLAKLKAEAPAPDNNEI